MKHINREVTELDFRKPEYIHAKVEDYEFREDGAVVRKDRWEMGLRKIAGMVMRTHEWEIPEIIQKLEPFRELFARLSDENQMRYMVMADGKYVNECSDNGGTFVDTPELATTYKSIDATESAIEWVIEDVFHNKKEKPVLTVVPYRASLSLNYEILPPVVGQE